MERWKKNEAWEKINSEFNASGNFPHFTKTIRSKYDTIKSIYIYSQKMRVAQARTNKNWWSVLSNFDFLRGKNIIIPANENGLNKLKILIHFNSFDTKYELKK